MKRIIHVFTVLICMISTVNVAYAVTQAERDAQAAFRAYLSSKRVNSKIDDKDNSVNFQYKNKLFWVTFKESGGVMLYTLHRAPIKMESDKQSREMNARRIENATIATSYLNAKTDYKAFVNGSRVEFVFPVFAANTEEYSKVFMTILKNMESVQEQFDKCYKVAKHTSDSIHNYWSQNDTSIIVVPQPSSEQIASTKNLAISKVDFRIVDENGNPISEYGESIRRSDIKFIQPQITVKASKKGLYHIGVVITTPRGKKLLPSQNSVRTMISTVEVDKKGKAIDLGSFGSKTGDFWRAGEYKVSFYEDGNLIKTTTFNVL